MLEPNDVITKALSGIPRGVPVDIKYEAKRLMFNIGIFSCSERCQDLMEGLVMKTLLIPLQGEVILVNVLGGDMAWKCLRDKLSSLKELSLAD